MKMSVVGTADPGSIAWVITATALVMLMTPALGFFYGGLVRKKNLVSTIAQCFIIFAVISIVWALWGYMLVFGPSSTGIIGFSPSLLGMNGLSINAINTKLAPQHPRTTILRIPTQIRSHHPRTNRRRMRRKNPFQVTLIFIVLWSTLIYAPIACWVWNPNGWLHQLGAIDFAGGIVVHISSGISALAAALVVGRRKGCAVPWQNHMKALDQKDHADRV